jgi:hypothetical protein
MNKNNLSSFQVISEKFKQNKILKFVGFAVLGLAGIYAVMIALRFMPTAIPILTKPQNYSSSYYGNGGGIAISSISPSAAPMAKMMDMGIEESLGLSQRNVAPAAEYDNSATVGSNAEEFETIEYRAAYQTRELKKTCQTVAGLKSRADVIFENATESDKYCNYSFKVERQKTAEILEILKNMKPRELTENIYTIKNQIEDYTGEIEILQNKLAVIDDTLNKATAAYDEVTALATDAKDAESLAKIISNKINIIKQLAQEKISISARLDQIRRAKTLQTDKLNYTYFNVSASDNSFVDWQNIKESWGQAVKYAINNINGTIQNVSLGLMAFLFVIFQFAAYGTILLIAAKYGWKFAKAIWKK